MENSLTDATMIQETASHQAMHNELIFSIICDLVRGETGYKPWFNLAPQLLCALARTCKAFSVPALKALWKSLDTLYPLVQTMPTDCWEVVHSRSEHATSDNIHTLRFIRPITASDCERFRVYAPFVRRMLDYGSFKSCPGTLYMDPNVFHFLAATFRKDFPSSVLLPSLEELDWATDDDLLFPHVLLLITPNLRKLTITLGCGDFAIRTAFFQTIMTVCKDLRSLVIHARSHPGQVAGISHLLCHLSRLQSLSVDAVSTGAYIWLAKHPELTKLTLGCLHTIDWNATTVVLRDESSFPVLKKIDLEREATEAHCLQLLQATQSLLTSVDLAISDTQTGSSFNRVLTAIQEHASPALHKLNLWGPQHGGQAFDPAIDPLIPAHLAPILTFRDLTHLYLNPFCHVEVDEPWIQTVTKSLAKIRTFYLLSRQSVTDPTNPLPKLSINGLVHFALNCPDLEELGLAFDAELPILPEMVSRHPSLHRTSLYLLYVGHSVVWEAYTVAAMFSDWFPKLLLIQAGPSNADDDDERLRRLQSTWDKVTSKIRMIWEVRNQERRSMKMKMESAQNGVGNAANGPTSVGDEMEVDG